MFTFLNSASPSFQELILKSKQLVSPQTEFRSASPGCPSTKLQQPIDTPAYSRRPFRIATVTRSSQTHPKSETSCTVDNSCFCSETYVLNCNKVDVMPLRVFWCKFRSDEAAWVGKPAPASPIPRPWEAKWLERSLFSGEEWDQIGTAYADMHQQRRLAMLPQKRRAFDEFLNGLGLSSVLASTGGTTSVAYFPEGCGDGWDNESGTEGFCTAVGKMLAFFYGDADATSKFRLEAGLQSPAWMATSVFACSRFGCVACVIYVRNLIKVKFAYGAKQSERWRSSTKR